MHWLYPHQPPETIFFFLYSENLHVLMEKVTNTSHIMFYNACDKTKKNEKIAIKNYVMIKYQEEGK